MTNCLRFSTGRIVQWIARTNNPLPCLRPLPRIELLNPERCRGNGDGEWQEQEMQRNARMAREEREGGQRCGVFECSQLTMSWWTRSELWTFPPKKPRGDIQTFCLWIRQFEIAKFGKFRRAILQNLMQKYQVKSRENICKKTFISYKFCIIGKVHR